MTKSGFEQHEKNLSLKTLYIRRLQYVYQDDKKFKLKFNESSTEVQVTLQYNRGRASLRQV